MRRDYFTPELRNVEADEESPAVVLTFDGPSGLLGERLENGDGDPLEDGEIDVAFRYTTPVDADDAAGVLSVTNRFTGEYVLETNADATLVRDLVRAARADDGDDEEWRYRVCIRRDDEEVATFRKRTLLVYDSEGDLRRDSSLIPGGVEL
ncbi:MAG: DUF5793 family protein [Haloarculaceae archaeon]